MYYRAFYHVSIWSAFPGRQPLRVPPPRTEKKLVTDENSFLLRVFPPFCLGLSRKVLLHSPQTTRIKKCSIFF